MERLSLHSCHDIPCLKGKCREMDLPLLIHREIHSAQFIGGVFLMQRRLGANGRIRCHHRRIRLISHPHFFSRQGGVQRRIRNDCRHVISIVPYPPGQDQAVRNICVGGVQRLGVACGGELVIRHLKTGQDRDNTGHSLRLCGVYSGHEPVGDCAVDHLDIQGIPGDQVFHILGRAGDLSLRIHAAG